MVNARLLADLQHVSDLLDGKVKPRKAIIKVEQPTYPVVVRKPKRTVVPKPAPKPAPIVRTPPPVVKRVAPPPTISRPVKKKINPEEERLLDEYKGYVEEINKIVLQQQELRKDPDKLDALIKKEAELQKKCDECLATVEKLRGI